MLYVTYIVLAVAVVLLSIKCAQYVDLLDKKTKLSGAFIGAVVLAAVTSLPELFTSISSVCILDSPGLVAGNVLGSNIFNTVIIAVLILINFKVFKSESTKISTSHSLTSVGALVMYGLTALATYTVVDNWQLLNINIVSILIMIVYAIVVTNMSGEASEVSAEDNSPLTVKQVIIRFSITAIFLVAVSIVITFVSDELAEKLNLGKTVAGAIFLGVATSLPELASSCALVKMGNYNAAFGNVLGSNLFNFIIFTIGDILYRGSIYIAEKQTIVLILGGEIELLAMLLIISLKQKKSTFLKSIIYVLCSLIVITAYLAFIYSGFAK